LYLFQDKIMAVRDSKNTIDWTLQVGAYYNNILKLLLHDEEGKNIFKLSSISFLGRGVGEHFKILLEWDLKVLVCSNWSRLTRASSGFCCSVGSSGPGSSGWWTPASSRSGGQLDRQCRLKNNCEICIKTCVLDEHLYIKGQVVIERWIGFN
jgi:hypothetical protein